MTPKQEIEAALRKAINAVVAEHVVDEYMRTTPNPSAADVPLLLGRFREIVEA